MVTTTLSQASTQTPPQPARTISRSVRPPVARAAAAPKVSGSGGTRVTAPDAAAADTCDLLLPGTTCVALYEQGQQPETCGGTAIIGACTLVP